MALNRYKEKCFPIMGVMRALLAHGAEQETGEAPAPARADDQQVGGRVQQLDVLLVADHLVENASRAVARRRRAVQEAPWWDSISTVAPVTIFIPRFSKAVRRTRTTPASSPEARPRSRMPG